MTTTDAKSKNTGCLLMIPVCLLAVWGSVVGVWITSCTGDFAGLSFPTALTFGGPLGVIAAIAALVLYAITRRLLRLANWSVTRERIVLIGPSVAFCLIIVIWAAAANRTTHRFQRLVLKPLPASIHDIQVAGFGGFLASRWLVRFSTDTNDLQRIVIRPQLVEAEPFDLNSILERDMFLRKVPWASSIPQVRQGYFYKRRTEAGQSETVAFLMYDKLTSQAWFVRSYQN